MPERPLKVEKLTNHTAKPTGSPFHSAMSQNTRGSAPNSAASIVGLRRLDLVQQLFVFGELANEGQHESGFARTRAADVEDIRRSHRALTPRPRP